MGKKIKIVLDTNVIISGFGWGGKPEEILKLIESEKILNVISRDIFDEISKVISYPKLKFSDKTKSNIMEFLLYYSNFVTPKAKINLITSDPSDNIFLECANEINADFIISGNKHLFEIVKFNDIFILKPEDFIKYYSTIK